MIRFRKRKVNCRDQPLKLTQVNENVIYQQIDANHPMPHVKKEFLCSESGDLPNQTRVVLDLNVAIPEEADSIPNHYAIVD